MALHFRSDDISISPLFRGISAGSIASNPAAVRRLRHARPAGVTRPPILFR
jgi:hypothetical protein